MKKRVCLIVTLLVAVCTMIGCGEKEERKTPKQSAVSASTPKVEAPTPVPSEVAATKEPTAAPSNPAVTKEPTLKPSKAPVVEGFVPTKVDNVTGKAENVTVDTIVNKKKNQSTIHVSARTADDKEVWFYDSEPFASTEETAPVFVITNVFDTTYICEDGIITGVDTATGDVRFVNVDFYERDGGNVSCYTATGNKHLYVSGYKGPDFMEIDENGKTVKRIDHLLEEQGLHPVSMDINQDDSVVTVRYDSDSVCARVNLSDYSVEK